jgi:hypothetical protein
MKQLHAEAEREWRLKAKARGKPRFFVQQFFQPLFIWLLVLTVLSIKDGFHLMAWAGTLPIFLLYGYLNGQWRWKDFEKKYPE